jgi:hypothetical protein
MVRLHILSLLLLAGCDGLRPAVPPARGAAAVRPCRTPALLPAPQRAGEAQMVLAPAVGLALDAFGVSLKVAWRPIRLLAAVVSVMASWFSSICWSVRGSIVW